MEDYIDRIVKGDTLTVDELKELFVHLNFISFDDKTLYDDLSFYNYETEIEKQFDSLEEILADKEIREWLKGKKFIYYKD